MQTYINLIRNIRCIINNRKAFPEIELESMLKDFLEDAPEFLSQVIMDWGGDHAFYIFDFKVPIDQWTGPLAENLRHKLSDFLSQEDFDLAANLEYIQFLCQMDNSVHYYFTTHIG